MLINSLTCHVNTKTTDNAQNCKLSCWVTDMSSFKIEIFSYCLKSIFVFEINKQQLGPTIEQLLVEQINKYWRNNWYLLFKK